VVALPDEETSRRLVVVVKALSAMQSPDKTVVLQLAPSEVRQVHPEIPPVEMNKSKPEECVPETERPNEEMV
jgi:hypothetical protein